MNTESFENIKVSAHSLAWRKGDRKTSFRAESKKPPFLVVSLMASAPTVICSELRKRGKHHVSYFLNDNFELENRQGTLALPNGEEYHQQKKSSPGKTSFFNFRKNLFAQYLLVLPSNYRIEFFIAKRYLFYLGFEKP